MRTLSHENIENIENIDSHENVYVDDRNRVCSTPLDVHSP